MSVDSKQFNRPLLSYEEVEAQIRYASQLRSEAFARGAEQLSAALGAGSRRLLGRVRVLHQNGDYAPGARRLGWFPVVPVAAFHVDRPARCK